MESTIGEGFAIMTVEQRKREIPLLAARIVFGAICSEKYCGKKDTVQIFFDDRSYPVHVDDFRIASQIAKKIEVEYVQFSGRSGVTASAIGMLEVIGKAQNEYARMTDIRAGKKGLIMLSDNDGCGFWRMRLPARHMKAAGWYADITSAMVSYEQLCEYDTIFVQRFHEWDAYYILERLKKAGKRIIYDIDDDLFSIPKENPASSVIKKDQQFAALETMKLADVVIVSTEVLKERFGSEVGQDKVIVIHNALELDGWPSVPLCGSPDGVKRIFWQGGTTHAEDWVVCIGAVESILKEMEDVRLTILGFLPPIVMDMVRRNNWGHRVEYMGFSAPETYYQLVKGIRAEVGICPLVDNRFNQGKSSLKFVENTVIGMPTVASNLAPYQEIENGKSGFLVSTEEEWYASLKTLLIDSRLGKGLLVGARRLVAERNDIRKVEREWSSVLCPV